MPQLQPSSPSRGGRGGSGGLSTAFSPGFRPSLIWGVHRRPISSNLPRKDGHPVHGIVPPYTSGVSELIEIVLVEAEVMTEFMKQRDPNLVADDFLAATFQRLPTR